MAWQFHFLKNIGIDLGTANVVIYVQGRGYVINEPALIAYLAGGKEKIVGREVMDMQGREHRELRVLQPLANGVIADFQASEDMIRGFIEQARLPKFLLNRIVVGVPSGITAVEENGVHESAVKAGGKHVHLIEEPMAAAVGIGLDVFGGKASMIVDIGGGTTDIAVINYGGIVVDETVRIAGYDLNNALINFLKNEYHLEIGRLTAEQVKLRYGKFGPSIPEQMFSVNGLDLINKLPRKLQLSNSIFDNAFRAVIQAITKAIFKTLEQLPPDLSEDILDHGMIITGGGSLLRGFDQYLRDLLGFPVSRPSNPLLTVAEGTRKILDNYDLYHPLLRH
ncbi:MAG: rod shape-determining protein MreB [Caldithrix sp.]|nr:rod shape-determining protein MreB [Caldithrix sp.]